MSKKIFLVMGATSGLGIEEAKAFLKQGHTVVIHGRHRDKTNTVKRELIAETGNSDVDILIADLESLASVKRMAEEFTEKYDHLDVLVNLFAPVLLSLLLIDSLGEANQRPRPLRPVFAFAYLFASSTEKGAQPTIYAATSPQIEGISNHYYGPKGEDKVSERYYTPDNEKAVWDYCMKVLGPYLV